MEAYEQRNVISFLLFTNNVGFKNKGVSYNQSIKKIFFLSKRANTIMWTCMNVHGRIKMFLEYSHSEITVLPESAWVACALFAEQVETG